MYRVLGSKPTKMSTYNFYSLVESAMGLVLLDGPRDVRISRSNGALFSHGHNLTCSAAGNPPPTHWTANNTVQRGPTFVVNLCEFVENVKKTARVTRSERRPFNWRATRGGASWWQVSRSSSAYWSPRTTSTSVVRVIVSSLPSTILQYLYVWHSIWDGAPISMWSTIIKIYDEQ